MTNAAGYALAAAGLLPVDLVVEEVAHALDVDRDALLGRSRAKHLMLARSVAMAVVRELCGMSYPALGRLFQRDSTTVMHHVANVQKDRRRRETAERIVRELRPPG